MNDIVFGLTLPAVWDTGWKKWRLKTTENQNVFFVLTGEEWPPAASSRNWIIALLMPL